MPSALLGRKQELLCLPTPKRLHLVINLADLETTENGYEIISPVWTLWCSSCCLQSCRQLWASRYLLKPPPLSTILFTPPFQANVCQLSQSAFLPYLRALLVSAKSARASISHQASNPVVRHQHQQFASAITSPASLSHIQALHCLLPLLPSTQVLQLAALCSASAPTA